MANEDKKDFNAMLHDSKDMPKFQTITDEKSIKKYGGDSTNSLLENLESQWGMKSQISRRGGGAERDAGKRGAHHYQKGQNKYKVLCEGL